MLTTIYLDGEMGRLFGKKWELAAKSPAHALRLINANRPGLFNWVRQNLKKYDAYRVVVTYEDGSLEELTTEEFPLDRQMKSVRFVPLIEGANAMARIVIGVIIFVAGFFSGGTAWAAYGPAMMAFGAGMALGGVAQLLTSTSKPSDSGPTEDGKASYYFNGSANTTQQGVPVQVIYGDKVLVGSHAISVALTVDQLMG